MVAELHAFERLLQQTLAAGSRLTLAAVEAQVDRRLGGLVGHQALTAAQTANGLVCEAMGRTADTHRLLEHLGRKLGLDVRAYGDGHKPPENDEPTKPFTGA